MRLRCGEKRISFLGWSRLWKWGFAGFSLGYDGLFQSESSVVEPMGGGAAICLVRAMGRCSFVDLMVGCHVRSPCKAEVRKSPWSSSSPYPFFYTIKHRSSL